MKNNHITLRLDEDLRNKLEEYSYMNDKKVSQVIRELIAEKQTNVNHEYIAFNGNKVNFSDLYVFQNIIFAELISFIYQKRYSNHIDEIDFFLEDLIDFIEIIIKNPIPDEEFKHQMDIVRDDLISVLNQQNDSIKYKFPHLIDYEKVWEFMAVIRYDYDDKKIL